MQKPRSLFYLGAVGGKLYAVSGWDDKHGPTTTVEMYDVKTNNWCFIKDLNDAVAEHTGTMKYSQFEQYAFLTQWQLIKFIP